VENEKEQSENWEENMMDRSQGKRVVLDTEILLWNGK
jgi:hypothetical protein